MLVRLASMPREPARVERLPAPRRALACLSRATSTSSSMPEAERVVLALELEPAAELADAVGRSAGSSAESRLVARVRQPWSALASGSSLNR